MVPNKYMHDVTNRERMNFIDKTFAVINESKMQNKISAIFNFSSNEYIKSGNSNRINNRPID